MPSPTRQRISTSHLVSALAVGEEYCAEVARALDGNLLTDDEIARLSGSTAKPAGQFSWVWEPRMTAMGGVSPLAVRE